MHLTRVGTALAAIALIVSACTGAVNDTTTTVPPPTTTRAPLATTLAPLPTTTAPTTTTTTAPPEVITIWADETTAASLEAIGGDFTTRRGVAVEVIEVPFTSIRSDVLGAVETGEVPDLFVGAHAWTGGLRDAGALTALRGLSGSTQDEFIGPAIEAFRLDGALYGIPYAAESIAVWINTSLAGANPPATFEGLLDVCDGLSLSVVCLAVAGGAGIPEAYYQYPFLTGFGASILTYEPGTGYIVDRAGIDEPEAIAASIFVAALDRGDYLPPLDYISAKQRFVEGEVAFWFTGAWETEAIEAAMEARGFEAIVAPVPPIDGQPAQPFLDALGIFQGAGASVNAQIFMREWLATGEAMIGLAPAPPLLPAHQEPASRIIDPLRKPFLDALRQAVPTPNVAVMTTEVWDTWGQALTAIRDDRADPESTLRDAATVIRTILGLPQPPIEGEADGEGG